MTLESLKFIKNLMKENKIPYEFGEWSSDLVYPYFVGEYTEPEFNQETRKQESSFILTGTTNAAYTDLEIYKQQIKKACNIQTILSNGNGLIITYAGSLNIPTGNYKFKRIQINLNIREWEV